MKKKLLTLMLAAACVVAGCKTSSKHEGAVTELPTDSLRKQWTRDLQMKGDQPRDMYVRGGSLFIYSENNVLYHMNRLSGAVVFMSDIAKPGATVRAPLLAKDAVVVPVGTRLEFLDKRGFYEKTIELRSPIRSGVATDGTAYYMGLDAADGTGRLISVDIKRPYSPAHWELMVGGGISSTPAFIGGALYAGSDDGNVYALTADRLAVWGINRGMFTTGGPITGDITAEKSGVYVASADSKLYCLDPGSGKVKWQYFAGSALYDSPAVTATSVYINVRDKGLTAIDKTQGKTHRQAKWVCADANMFLAEGERHAFLRGKNNMILAVDKTTGEVVFRSRRKDLVAFATNTTDGLIYAGTKSGEVMAAVAVLTHGTVGELVWMKPAAAAAMLASR